jgi:hypothetical protein
MDSQVYNVIAKYSDRLHLSDKKSNKVERPIQQNYLNIEKYIKDELTRRPSSQNSLPKTEKVSQRKDVYSSVVPISSEPYLRNDIEDIRQRLVKKSRIYSNKPKPSWWGWASLMRINFIIFNNFSMLNKEELRKQVIQYFRSVGSGENIVQCIKEALFLHEKFSPVMVFEM